MFAYIPPTVSVNLDVHAQPDMVEMGLVLVIYCYTSPYYYYYFQKILPFWLSKSVWTSTQHDMYSSEGKKDSDYEPDLVPDSEGDWLLLFVGV